MSKQEEQILNGKPRHIDSAPTDGREVRLYWGGIHDGAIGFYCCGWWGFTDSLGRYQDFTNKPTGWLPQPPVQS